ncbi:cytospin-A [Solea solea]|uniref:cytospin-A n=1 Tax=Solea solea TaxID=90069 RepID=UPI00272D0039|nr:cytospin-A [Solea solea]XP_058471309.1 cytospin-A [Solea solea]
MGNFSTKDSHGPTGTHGDSFHTPPATPQSGMPPFIPQLTTPLSSLAAPVSPPPPIPVQIPSTVKTPQPTTTITTTTTITASSSPDQRPHASVGSSSSTTGLSISPVHSKPGATVVKGAPALGRNGGPPTSSPRTPGSKGKSVPLSPSKSPSSPCSASPLAGSSSSQSWRERDSGLSQSLLPAHESGDSHAEELGRLLQDSRTILGITDGTADTAEILRHFLTEVKNLKSTLETERAEWLQFQADLQVAVAVADRLRAETEEEMTALRVVHKDVERELAAAHQRQKETDVQLVTLSGELKESRQRLATLNPALGKTVPQDVSCLEAETPSTEPTNTSESKEGTQGGTEGAVHRLGREGPERGCENDATKNGVSEEARSGGRGVAKRYLRNVTNEQRSVGDEARSTETRRTVTTERSRSLSRLPATSDFLTVPNGTSPSNTAATDVHTNMNVGQLRGRKGPEWQESKPSTDIGKREETLNKYNSTLTELPPTKSQDGFNMLLRRHGGSKRNSMLRWCQSRTQGYKNIDITNFSSSWADGLAFCAVYHTYLPSHVAYSSLAPENKKDNLSLAFKTGETVGIAQTLTVEEMLRAGGPDWQRVLSYVESMYRHFEM